MSIPFGNDTVTLVRRTETLVNSKTHATYSTAKLTGCSWRRTTRIVRNDNALIKEESVVCRVPVGQTRPSTGDLMILGDVAVTVTSSFQYQQLIDQYKGADGAFVVTSVKDNARPEMPMPHWAARGA